MNRSELQALATLRLREARVLFKAKQYSGAYYLAGYSVECALKACIARQTQRFDFPDKKRAENSYSHQPSGLLKVADLEKDLQADMKANTKLQASWDQVNSWSEQSRYKLWSQAEANAMIEAAGRRQDGVLPWIKQRW